MSARVAVGRGLRRLGLPCALLLLAAALFGARAEAQEPAPGQAPAAAPAAAPQEPVRISADAAEYFNAESLVVFTGSVVATQAEATLTADRMEVRFTPSEAAPGGRAGQITDAQSGRRISSLTATGGVTFRQTDPETGKERYATGDKGVYAAEARTVTMTGSPRLWEDKNVIVGEEMVFFLDDKRVVVKGKVNLTVYPDQAPGKAAPK